MSARAFTLTRLDHVQLAMPPGSEAVAESFYVGVLGLTRVEKPPALAKRGGCWFRGDGLELHLGVEADFRPARKAHPALRVEGLDALAEVLQVAGYEVRWSDEVPGTRRFHTDDPFGNRLEFIAAGS